MYTCISILHNPGGKEHIHRVAPSASGLLSPGWKTPTGTHHQGHCCPWQTPYPQSLQLFTPLLQSHMITGDIRKTLFQPPPAPGQLPNLSISKHFKTFYMEHILRFQLMKAKDIMK